MPFRPYPNAARALRQLDRHYQGPPVLQMPECLRPMADSLDRLRANTERAAEQGYGAGLYVLSTRRPGVVSGGG
ncbi:hypothetical protein [Streptomyces sp. NBC_01373]|uniref:hypothetical protein n=1 Tax=Streptomyces sp. NBC_01373 TaxID=2903843 RepID=UPI0022521D75|nr:hypothetical protein [Streptomyces sp. NBC_01373]MCX4704390.1 hypothetical protein [Streptomyces sp. NBC_01373]MCX4707130.1 hypothetical protein [Streptomyces sp. NBC_01373]